MKFDKFFEVDPITGALVLKNQLSVTVTQTVVVETFDPQYHDPVEFLKSHSDFCPRTWFLNGSPIASTRDTNY